MKEYLRKFIFFIIVSVTAAVIFRMAFPKTINVRVIGTIATITDVSGAVDANVTGSVDTQTKLGF